MHPSTTQRASWVCWGLSCSACVWWLASILDAKSSRCNPGCGSAAWVVTDVCRQCKW